MQLTLWLHLNKYNQVSLRIQHVVCPSNPVCLEGAVSTENHIGTVVSLITLLQLVV